jgi:hypothetical protein
MHRSQFLLLSAAVALTGCAQLRSGVPLVLDGALRTVSAADLRAAIDVFERHFSGDGSLAPRVFRIHVADHDSIELHYSRSGVADEWRTAVRIKGKWELSRVIISPSPLLPGQ